jgi:hypothetical protein
MHLDIGGESRFLLGGHCACSYVAGVRLASLLTVSQLLFFSYYVPLVYLPATLLPLIYYILLCTCSPWNFSETTMSNEYFRLLIEERWSPKMTHNGKPWTGPDQFGELGSPFV